ncbi:MAG: hypothetical protein IKJ82_08820 [Oscillospiraceae bacterium]|nr:hypothetical protein [Oscillospiraceae bacterium]
MENENIVSGAASTDGAASFSDEDFMGGFSESFGFTPERSEEENAESERVNVLEGASKGQVDDKGEKGTPKVPEGNEPKPAESGAEGAQPEENFVFKEHGKEFSAPKSAVEAFAKAVGRSTGSLIDVYQKGCNYDVLSRKLDEIRSEGELFEKVAQARGLSKENLKAELLSTLERIPVEKLRDEILGENPGMKSETAEELAKFRLNEQKPKAEEPKAEKIDPEENEARLRELEIFEANHPELAGVKLPKEVVLAWEKSGVPIEKAYEDFRKNEELAQLREKVAKLEKEAEQKAQKEYAQTHSPGSAGSPVGKTPADEFIEGLFAEY